MKIRDRSQKNKRSPFRSNIICCIRLKSRPKTVEISRSYSCKCPSFSTYSTKTKSIMNSGLIVICQARRFALNPTSATTCTTGRDLWTQMSAEAMLGAMTGSRKRREVAVEIHQILIKILRKIMINLASLGRGSTLMQIQKAP